MASFPESIAGNFSDWAFPIFRHDVFLKWAEAAQANFLEVQQQTENGYGLPELETLRAETCYCIIHGQWQAAMCLTNILLEAFLKLALIYSNTDQPEEEVSPLTRLRNSLSNPVQKYMQMKLNDTINIACKQGLIDNESKEMLHDFRKRFRNAFFHADMQSMFGDQTTPVTGIDFETRDIEHEDIPIYSMPLLFGEALWQNAQANAIPYFKEVDGLIRETLPKVFPGIDEKQSENMNE